MELESIYTRAFTYILQSVGAACDKMPDQTLKQPEAPQRKISLEEKMAGERRLLGAEKKKIRKISALK